MRLLVTGAGGQFGHDLAQVCAEAGDEIVAERVGRHADVAPAGEKLCPPAYPCAAVGNTSVGRL